MSQNTEHRYRCIIITPFDAAGQRVRDALSRAVSELGIEVMRLEDHPSLTAGASIAESVTRAIEEADLVIADISRQNPNVMYEIGFAHALRKPTFLILSAASSLPSDLAGHVFVTYDVGNLSGLVNKVSREARLVLNAAKE